MGIRFFLKNSTQLDENGLFSLAITLIAVIVLVVILVISYNARDFIAVAITAGALGGLGHEFAQSGGTISFYKIREDGIYLGSLAGIVLGAIAGLLFIRVVPPTDISIILVDALLAGLGLKGVAEAVGGHVTSRVGESFVIENINFDHANNRLVTSLRNDGIVPIVINRIYINSTLISLNLMIQPADVVDDRQNPIPATVGAPGSNSIRVFTMKGTFRSSTF